MPDLRLKARYDKNVWNSILFFLNNSNTSRESDKANTKVKWLWKSSCLWLITLISWRHPHHWQHQVLEKSQPSFLSFTAIGDVAVVRTVGFWQGLSSRKEDYGLIIFFPHPPVEGIQSHMLQKSAATIRRKNITKWMQTSHEKPQLMLLVSRMSSSYTAYAHSSVD